MSPDEGFSELIPDTAEQGIDEDVDVFAHLFRDLSALTVNSISLLGPTVVDAVGLDRIDMFLEAVSEQMEEYPEAQRDFDRLVESIEVELEARRKAFAVIFEPREEAATAA